MKGWWEQVNCSSTVYGYFVITILYYFFNVFRVNFEMIEEKVKLMNNLSIQSFKNDYVRTQTERAESQNQCNGSILYIFNFVVLIL